MWYVQKLGTKLCDFMWLMASLQNFNFLILVPYMLAIMKKYFQLMNPITRFQQIEALDR